MYSFTRHCTLLQSNQMGGVHSISGMLSLSATVLVWSMEPNSNNWLENEYLSKVEPLWIRGCDTTSQLPKQETLNFYVI